MISTKIPCTGPCDNGTKHARIQRGGAGDIYFQTVLGIPESFIYPRELITKSADQTAQPTKSDFFTVRISKARNFILVSFLDQAHFYAF